MLEGSTVENVLRLLNKQQIYCEPTPEFIPFVYNPLYYYVSAGISFITGTGFLPLRLVSTISTLLSLIFIFLLVKKETGEIQYGIVSAGLFASTFQLGGYWFDIARVDMLHLCFLLISIYLIRNLKNPKYLIYTAIFASLSFFTKQSVLLIFLPIILYLIKNYKKQSLIFILPFSIIIIIVIMIKQITSGGWYFYWNYSRSSSQGWELSQIYGFWLFDLLKFFGITTLFAVLYFKIKKDNFFIVLLISVIISSWILRVHYGGFVNSVIPSYAFLSILSVLFIKNYIDNLNNNNNNNNYLNKILVMSLLLLQFVVIFYNPTKAIPNKEDIEQGNQFVERIKNAGDEVFVPGHSYITRYAGQKSFVYWVVWNAPFLHSIDDNKHLEKSVNNMLKQQKFSAIFLHEGEYLPGIEKYYQLVNTFLDYDIFYYKAIGKSRKYSIYKPKKLE